MEVKIIGIGDKGIQAHERIGLKALRACNLKFYMIFKTNLTDSGFYHKSKESYWFMPQELNEGDKIVIYTRKGTDSYKENEDGTKTYFYYWGLDTPIFNTEKSGVVLSEVNDWQLSRNF